MSSSATLSDTSSGRGFSALVRDYITLTKPSINRMCVLMAAGGMFLAPRSTDGSFALTLGQAAWVLIGTALAIASANTLNQWLERNTDGLMRRTKDRPLAAKRISANGALSFGIILGLLSVVVLALSSNLTTTLLGAGAIVSYVCIYTPMKYKAPVANAVGAIPGAVPPLMGWTAITGTMDWPGLLLFGLVFVWQMPHFIAISVFRRLDYDAAGIKTVPGVRGLRVAKIQSTVWALFILPVSIALAFTDVAGLAYGITATLAGLGFVYMSARGELPPKSRDAQRAFEGPMNRWAHKLFVASLVYLPAIVAGLALDVLL